MRVALGEAMLSIGAARTAQAEFEALADYPRLLKCLRLAILQWLPFGVYVFDTMLCGAALRAM